MVRPTTRTVLHCANCSVSRSRVRTAICALQRATARQAFRSAWQAMESNCRPKSLSDKRLRRRRWDRLSWKLPKTLLVRPCRCVPMCRLCFFHIGSIQIVSSIGFVSMMPMLPMLAGSLARMAACAHAHTRAASNGCTHRQHRRLQRNCLIEWNLSDADMEINIGGTSAHIGGPHFMQMGRHTTPVHDPDFFSNQFPTGCARFR
jgi:hypothetical protein